MLSFLFRGKTTISTVFLSHSVMSIKALLQRFVSCWILRSRLESSVLAVPPQLKTQLLFPSSTTSHRYNIPVLNSHTSWDMCSVIIDAAKGDVVPCSRVNFEVKYVDLTPAEIVTVHAVCVCKWIHQCTRVFACAVEAISNFISFFISFFMLCGAPYMWFFMLVLTHIFVYPCNAQPCRPTIQHVFLATHCQKSLCIWPCL